jgi:hypothetical protein
MGGRHIPIPVVLALAIAAAAAMYADKARAHDSADASLLQACVDPVLAPAESSDNELAAERLRVAKAYLDCKELYAALADRAK